MNVLEIVSNTGVNGAIHHCLMVSRELARRGHQVTIVCQQGSWIEERAEAEGIDTILSNLHRWPTDELRRIAAVARRRQIDVIHTHMSRAHFFGVLLRWFANIPCVATAQSRHIQLHWMLNDYVLAASDATQRYHRWRNLVRPSRIETVHNFVDSTWARTPSPPTRNVVRASFGLPESSVVLGVVGDVIARKGLLHLIGGLPRILQAAPTARLLVVGRLEDRDYRRKVARAARQLGVGASIVWAGYREDVRETLAAMDIFVFASLEETLPLAVLEAMASGLPVVSTDVGGTSEVIVPGMNGTLVPPGDGDALAEAVMPLLDDEGLRRRYGQAAQQSVIERFSSDSMIPRIEAALGRVVRGRRAA